MTGAESAAWPHPADFAAPPARADLERWTEADRAARPARLARLRQRMEEAGVDGYFGLRWEHMRYLTGLPFDEREVTSAGDSGKFLITGTASIVLADSRYTIAVRRDAPESRVFECYNALAARWPDLVAEAGVQRVAVEATTIPHLVWERLAAAAPGVELVPIEGWVEADRQVKEPAEIERIAAACAVSDRALASLLPSIRPGVTEAELALDLEWRMRTGGAERLAFDVACLAGPNAALPHGSPGEARIQAGQVLLFDFGAQVAGYRSDMTRTLFVGEPGERDLGVYEVVAASQEAAISTVRDALAAARHGAPLPSGPDVDAISRGVIEADGRWPAFGHGLGHGIGIAVHELPGLGRHSAATPLPTPTVFSIEPGIYLEGETGVRIEDLVAIDASAGSLDRLTRFPTSPVIVGS
ncbi:MAG: aminopeptidase P family protein [Chloroflexi bacterium]|nr:aminopeptidase P family protein [Chloroflexota bacterium]